MVTFNSLLLKEETKLVRCSSQQVLELCQSKDPKKHHDGDEKGIRGNVQREVSSADFGQALDLSGPGLLISSSG